MRLALVLLLALTADVAAQGRLTVEAPRRDLGQVDEGTTPAVTFTVRNAGDAPLRLTSVEASCGCTAPDYPTDALAPGADAEIRVTYDTRGRPGPFDKAVFVRAGDAGAVTLRLVGVVVPALARSGAALGSLIVDAVERDLGEVPRGEVAQTSFRFTNGGTAPLRIERAETPDGVSVSVSDGPLFANDLRGMFVTIEDPAALADPDGAFRVPITLHTTDRDQPTKTLTVRGTMGPPRTLPDDG